MRILGWIAGLVVVAAGLWVIGSWAIVSGIEEAKYTVIGTPVGYELRRYEPSIVAQTPMTSMDSRDTGAAFRAIAGYIFGGNEGKASIAMTAPVVMDAPAPEKIAMTTPVIMDGGMMRFVMPSKYTSVAELPKPKDSRVTLVQMPAKVVAALRFGWYATPARFADKARELEGYLERDGIKSASKPYLASYNPPFSAPMVKRHDVLIDLEGK